MDLEQILHMMKEGEGGHSYANNSSQQKVAILKAKPLLQESLFDFYCNRQSFPDCIRFADMGCSSGPNALLPTWEIIDALDRICHQLNREPPVLQAFLNDLPGNDFNNVLKSLPNFYERLKKDKGHEFGSCFIGAVAGSFYGRLFPSNFLHFVYSCYSLHWLSQVPKGLVSESGTPVLNKGGVYVAKFGSPPGVHKAYLDQFKSDFTSFLKFRSEELKPGGRMILTLMGSDKYHAHLLELMGMVINDMVSQGLIEESKLQSFNFPIYSPYAEEVMEAIQREGSFNIHRFETFHLSWLEGFESNDTVGSELYKYAGGKYVANHIRAVLQSILAIHFGSAVMGDMFHRFSIKVVEYLEMGVGAYTNFHISLLKK